MAEISDFHSARSEGEAPKPTAPQRLWRDVLGERLRSLRRGERGDSRSTPRPGPECRRSTSSDFERGRKEPSSYMIAAIAGALCTTLVDLLAPFGEKPRVQPAAVRYRASVQPIVRGSVLEPVLALAATTGTRWPTECARGRPEPNRNLPVPLRLHLDEGVVGARVHRLVIGRHRRRDGGTGRSTAAHADRDKHEERP